jgi:hypothetical protein
MPRMARIVAAGYSQYFTQRGNYRQKIFYYIEKEAKEWKEFIVTPDNHDEMKRIKGKTRIGRPLRTNDLVERLEGQLKRVFKLKPKGRPNKKKVNK